MAIITVFLLALVVGILSTSFWIPEDDVGRGYFQTNALIVLGLLAIVAGLVAFEVVTLWPQNSAPLWCFYAGFGFAALSYGGIWLRRWMANRIAAAIALGLLTVSLLRAELAVRFATSFPELTAAAVLLGALVLGWSLVTMLLGHWYLVAPRLDFLHLKRFSFILAVLLVVRSLASATSILASSKAADPTPWLALTSAGGWAMFLWVRVLWGLVGAVLLAAMALHCARRGSNQSATGILYVVVVSVWIGEATALFLQAMTGVAV